MGGELAQEAEWSEGRSLDWWLLDHADHRGVQHVVTDLNRVYRDSPAIWARDDDSGGFEWIDADDSVGNVFAFLRWGYDGTVLACVANFAAVPHDGYRLALPFEGRWDEVLNTDSALYSGSGVGNLGGVQADAGAHRGRPASARVVLPPLATVWFRPSA
jgi:1,4-alpha-glucan branching enzyme